MNNKFDPWLIRPFLEIPTGELHELKSTQSDLVQHHSKRETDHTLQKIIEGAFNQLEQDIQMELILRN